MQISFLKNSRRGRADLYAVCPRRCRRSDGKIFFPFEKVGDLCPVCRARHLKALSRAICVW